MTREELARAVAAQLGGEVAAETEVQLRDGGTRGFGILTDVAAIGSFIAQAAQLALAIYQLHKDRAGLISLLDEQAPKLAKLPEEKRRDLIERIVDRLGGSH